MDETNVQFVTSERNKPLLVVNFYKFSRCRETSQGETYWRCCVKSCKASCKTLGEVITSSNFDHNHENCVKKLPRQKLSQASKRKAGEVPTQRPSQIVRLAIDKDNVDSLQAHDIQCARRNVYNSRRKKYPKLPTSVNEVHDALDALKICTITEENFLLINDKDSNIVIFSCVTNLKTLCKAEKIFVDGTFEYCPKYFLQLFSLHGYINGNYIPLVFCLLTRKLESAYLACFNIIMDVCKEHGFDFNPKVFVCDLELGIRNAILLAWKDCEIVLCKFHLCQSWWRAIQRFGLSTQYKNGCEIGKWLKSFFGLSFLNERDVNNAFEKIMERKPNQKAVGLEKFANYIFKNYVCFAPSLPFH